MFSRTILCNINALMTHKYVLSFMSTNLLVYGRSLWAFIDDCTKCSTSVLPCTLSLEVETILELYPPL